MFLQNLFQKITDKLKDFAESAATIKDFEFTRENIEFLVFNNFRELFLSIIALFSFITVVILGVIFIFNLFTPGSNRMSPLDSPDTTQEAISYSRSNKFEDVDFLVQDTIIYPDLATFTISNEYIDFMALKKLNKPDLKIIMDEFDNLIELSLDDACLFNFEKRSQYEKKSQN